MRSPVWAILQDARSLGYAPGTEGIEPLREEAPGREYHLPAVQIVHTAGQFIHRHTPREQAMMLP